MKKMTPRERIIAAAKHRPVDRLPLLLWIEPHTILKMTQTVVRPRGLAERLYFDAVASARDMAPTEQLRNMAPFLTYPAAAGYMMQLGTDMLEFPWFNPTSFVKKFRIENGKPVITDAYGIERSMMGLYLEITRVPCSTPEELDAYRLPKLNNAMLYQGIRMFKRANPHIAAAGDIPGIQDVAQWFMGMENLYLWMAMYPDKIKAFFAKLLDHTLELIRGLMRAGADVIAILDDYGAQDRMLISKKMWEDFTFPCLKRQCEEVHRHGGVVMLHSCGRVHPLLEGIADAGVDMLQSFQPAAGNNLAEAKRGFGDRLCFVTGIDSQTLSSLTPEQVRESVLESVRVGGEGGGFVLATNHALQVDTPDENLRALFRALREVRGTGPRPMA